MQKAKSKDRVSALESKLEIELTSPDILPGGRSQLRHRSGSWLGSGGGRTLVYI